MLKLQDRQDLCIAQGALTNSKRPETFVKGVYPTHLKKGAGCYVWDYDGNKYFDFITGLGSNLFGYCQEDIDKAIIERLRNGITFSLATEDEVILAEKLKNVFPFIDHIKVLKTGSEACSAAIRIARAATKKEWILSEGYHGWHDQFVSLSEPALGIPEDYEFEHFIGKLGTKSIEEGIAGIIIEPIMTEFSEGRIKWLRDLRKYCTVNNILLIFDEVITGFRFPNFSVANMLQIEPDLIVLGKAMANGLPIAVVGGKKEIMNCGEYFVSSTFAGETLSIAAACKTIDLLKGKYKITDLWAKGKIWLDEFNSLWPEKIRIEGYPTRGRFEGEELTKALFFQEAVSNGLLFGPSWFFNFPLAEKSRITLDLCRDIICKLKVGNVKLRGQMPKSPFADQMRKR